MDIIGMQSFQDIKTIQTLKKAFVWFDKIGVIDWLDGFTPRNNSEEEVLLNLIWLKDQGIIFTPDEFTIDEEIATKDTSGLSESDRYQEALDLYDIALLKIKSMMSRTEGLSKLHSMEENSLEESKVNEQKSRQYRVRSLSQKFRLAYNENVIPLLSNDFEPYTNSKEETDVLRIIFKNLPIPDESVPWEDIIEFKEKFRDDFIEINDWISNVILNNRPAPNFSIHLEKLMNDYRKHMDIHKVAARNEVFKSILTIPRNLLLGEWDKLATAFLGYEHYKIALMKAEMEAPGRSIAYIVKTQDEFQECA